jgi:hypothetical protein
MMLLAIHYGKQPCRRSMTLFVRIRLGIWFHFYQEGNLLDENGSIGPKEQQMVR